MANAGNFFLNGFKQEMNDITTRTWYLEAAPVYGLHGCGLRTDHPDIFTAALKNGPQLRDQGLDEPCNPAAGRERRRAGRESRVREGS